MSTSHQPFSINVNLNQNARNCQVTPIETTDGVVYYSCCIDGQELSQIRKEIYGKWEQLWGDLNERAVATLGEAIDMHNIDQ